MSAVAGLRGTGDWATDERPKNFRELILWRNRRGTAPILALSSKANKEAVTDPEFSWWDEPVAILRLQVNKSGDYGTTETLITVDSGDPDATNPDRVWGTAKHLVPGDLLLVEKSTETVAFDNEILIVDEVISDTQFTVVRGASGTTAAAIVDNAYLLHIGSVMGEGRGAPLAVSRNPVKYYNLAQIWKTSYEITGTGEVTETRTGDPVRNDKKRRMWDHARKIEMSILFGKRYEDTDPVSGKPRRFTNGIRNQLPSNRVTIFSSAVTTNSFLDAAYPVFDYETDAGDERMVFCGNGALNELNKIVAASGDMQWGPKVTQWGLNLKTLELPQGTLFLRTHPIFNQHSQLQYSALMIDFSALRWRHTKGRDTKFMDNIQNKDEDLRRGQWFTEGGVELWYGGLTCGYLGNIRAT